MTTLLNLNEQNITFQPCQNSLWEKLYFIKDQFSEFFSHEAPKAQNAPGTINLHFCRYPVCCISQHIIR